MKARKQLLAKLLFLMLILFSLGLEVSSHYSMGRVNIENSAEQNSPSVNEHSITDSFNDDHIYQFFEPSILDQKQSFIPIQEEFNLGTVILASCWQPPQ